MHYTNFTSNTNHHLCNLCFSDIRVDDTLAMYQEREIRLRNACLGTAEIVAMRNFPLSHLTNELSFAVCGHNAAYLNAVLQKMHGPLLQHSRITWVVFQWKKPDLEALKEVFAQAWQKNLEKFVTTYRDTPESKNLQYALNLP
jgi:hypothetical protein